MPSYYWKDLVRELAACKAEQPAISLLTVVGRFQSDMQRHAAESAGTADPFKEKTPRTTIHIAKEGTQWLSVTLTYDLSTYEVR